MQLNLQLRFRRPDPGPFGRREPSPFAPLIALVIVALIIATFVFLVTVPAE